MKQNYSVVATSNYNQESFNERFVACMLTEQAAQQVCDILNEEHCESDSFYVVRPNEYKLYKFEP